MRPVNPLNPHAPLPPILIRWQGFAYAMGVFAVLLVAYVRTLMPGTVGGDAGELQYAPSLLALVHPTGQPLYVLLGKLWTTIFPFGSVAYRMNLLAAISAASAGGSMTWLLWRMYRQGVVAILAGLTLGFGATIWGQAVLADKYAFTVLLAVWIVGLGLYWSKIHWSAPDSMRANRLLYALSAAFGIGLLHHRSLALFAVGIAVMVVWHLRTELWRKPRRTLICAALVFLPALIVYPTVLPLLRANDASPLMWQPTSARDWLDFLLERHVLSGEALVFDNAANISTQLHIYAETLLSDYTLFVPLLGLVGVFALLKFDPAAGVFLGVSFLLQAFLSANFRGNERQFTYYLPSFVALVYGFAIGAVMWSAFMDRLIAYRRDGITARMAVLLLLAIPAFQFITIYPDKRLDAVYGEPLDIWRQTLKTGNMGERLSSGFDQLPPDAVLAADWEQITILWYEQQVEGHRPDVTLVYPIERYADFIDTGRPICLARHLPVDAVWHPSNVDALVCLHDAPQTELPADITPVGADLAEGESEPVLRLAGYTLNEAPIFPAGHHAQVVLYWQALTDIEADWSLSLQVLDANYQVVWSRDIQSPVMGLYPTSRWSAGEVVADYHEISLDRDFPSGQYLWTVVVYRQAADGAFVQLHDSDGGINILGGTFEVIPG